MPLPPCPKNLTGSVCVDCINKRETHTNCKVHMCQPKKRFCSMRNVAVPVQNGEEYGVTSVNSDYTAAHFEYSYAAFLAVVTSQEFKSMYEKKCLNAVPPH